MEGVPEFSRNYLVFGSDEKVIREVIGTEARQKIAEERGWSVEGLSEWLILYGPSIKPQALTHVLQRAESISNRLRSNS